MRKTVAMLRAEYTAVIAMGVDPFEFMHRDLWHVLTDKEKVPLLSSDNLVPSLIGKEGHLLEVKDLPGSRPRRFTLGITNHWEPRHIEQGGARHGFSCPREGYHEVETITRNPSRVPGVNADIIKRLRTLR